MARAKASDDAAVIAHQRLQIEKLTRQLYGRRSERAVRLLDQMELAFEELESSASEDEIAAERAAAKTTNVVAFMRKRPARQPFPEHLPRERVVEVGNLASAARGFGGRFLPALRRTLVDLGFVWAVFTATREVRGILEHFAFDARVLAPAAPGALPDGGIEWGTYYAHEPSVMAGCIR